MPIYSIFHQNSTCVIQLQRSHPDKFSR
ncbi:hypothetical protein ACTQWG_03770 [Blautia sp. HCP3S3_H10_1]